jgi:hypothetical protein
MHSSLAVWTVRLRLGDVRHIQRRTVGCAATSLGSPECCLAVGQLFQRRGGKLLPSGRDRNGLSGQRATGLKVQPRGGGRYGDASLRAA